MMARDMTIQQTTLTLRQIQLAMVRFCTQSDLKSYACVEDLSATDRRLLDSMPLSRLAVYSDAIYSKRIQFSREVFRLSSKALGSKKWQQLVTGYWEIQTRNAARPIDALSHLPEYLGDIASNDNSDLSMVWSELADYELTLSLVSNSHDEFLINDRSIPKNVSGSSLTPVINSTVRVKEYHYTVSTIAHQIEKYRKPSTERLSTPIYMVFYQDLSSRKLRIQQVGRIVADIISKTQDRSTTISDIYEIVNARLAGKSASFIEASVRAMLEQLRTAGVITAVTTNGSRIQK